MLKTPVLLLLFNRPEATQKVWEIIRQIKPYKLYVAADGPRKNVLEDWGKCRAVRRIISTLDWPCELKTLFREENLGCKRAVSNAVDWFFGEVEEGIILEDDCLPDSSFFPFCENLLQKYRYDERVMMIAGNNQLNEWVTGASYLYSRLGAIWGWASWRRAWAYYDVEMKKWPKAREMGLFKSVFRSDDQAAYREMVCENTYKGLIDTWDYQWTFSRLCQNGLSVIPTKNLVKNIGFGEGATHTVNPNTILSSLQLHTMQFPLISPEFICFDEWFDDEVFKKTIRYQGKIPLAERLKMSLKRLAAYVKENNK